jgi:gamma-glutamyl-gamma-aminobutyrate hydrolase PuuD
MSHEFLTSLHSQVIGVPAEEQRVAKPTSKVSKDKDATVDAVEADERHRTIGVSMPPKLRQRAAERAAAIGLSFSRYVQWCLEAELDGSTLEERFNKTSN